MINLAILLEYFSFKRLGQHAGRTGLALAACLAVSALASTKAEAQPDIDLKLFDGTEVDRSKGCSVTLWQADRNPHRDRFAYLFVEPLMTRAGSRQPARIRIGSQTVMFQRVATGGRTSGYGLAEFQLYKGPSPDEFLILELKLVPAAGESVEIDGGTLSLVMKGRQVFWAAVKGAAGCMNVPTTASVAAPAAAPAPAPAAPRQGPAPGSVPFDRYAIRANIVPVEIIRAAQQNFGCAAELMRTNAVGFVVSEESAIWQLGCERLAHQMTSVFALVQFQNPARSYRFLEFKPPRGRERTTGSAVLFDPDWNLQTRTVTSITRTRALGDCGTFERHRVTEAGQFVLTEFREKKECDGSVGRPQDWPIVFRAN
jgi:hypothetical protein